ncbi:MAG: hypothetical protein H5T60_06615 [Anaerolineae bacterium]|nr:hypothetical protein [Anaerolineae bacterium]
MKRRWTFVSGLLAVVLLALAVGPGQAQGPQPSGEGVQPEGEVGIQAALGTAFTYQGQLKKDGNPVNGTCDFRFNLWDAAAGGNQIGPNQEKTNVPVSNGLFTVQLDFGAGAFQGDARWLWVRVRCPAGSGTYTALSPRQPLTPAPYAQALPGLWTQQNATSPNIIGGYSGNSVTGGVVGAAIGGGGASGNTNRVTDNYGTVGGGQNNQAGDGGGTTDDASYATIGGGSRNSASSTYATIGGGYRNTASGNYATIGGGNDNIASSSRATIGGGNDNTASGYAATVGGGENNTAGGDLATVGGGWANIASDWSTTIGGGYENTASGTYATVPGGWAAGATHYGEMAYATGSFGFGARGDAQTSLYVMRIERLCEAGTWYDLYLNGNLTPPEFLTIAQGRTVAFDALVVGRTLGGESAGYYIRGVVENAGGTVSFIGTPVVSALGEDDYAWNVRAVAHNTYGLVIQVQGNGETIRWVATVRTAEVSW